MVIVEAAKRALMDWSHPTGEPFVPLTRPKASVLAVEAAAPVLLAEGRRQERAELRAVVEEEIARAKAMLVRAAPGSVLAYDETGRIGALEDLLARSLLVEEGEDPDGVRGADAPGATTNRTVNTAPEEGEDCE